ncbi:MAG: LlaJI family restriction endonuclease [Romboutsia timonensis]|uniref:LlaJI family restriction endonuclease n=2 Tax=Romboutsia timonensis TaxID=1776391 RepID=UPI0039966E66
MILQYVKEQKRYTKDELNKLFKSDNYDNTDEIKDILKKLREYGILKTVKYNSTQKNLSDLIEEDLELSEGINDKYYYVFKYVGIIMVSKYIIICIPKYVTSSKENEYINDISKFKNVLSVIKKYNSKNQTINLYEYSEESTSFNFLAIMIHMINDYYTNGAYINNKNIIEKNGNGEILWDKTINESFAIISNNRPYYPEMYTRNNVNDEYDYFTRLHKCLINLFLKRLKEYKLMELLDIQEDEISEEEIEDFGDDNYILYKLEQELNIQFNTKKQIILKSIYSYIQNRGNLNSHDNINLLGTSSFNLVWEEVCSNILNNMLDDNIKDIDNLRDIIERKCSEKLKEANNLDKSKENILRLEKLLNSQETLSSIIEKPSWVGYYEENDNNEFIKKADKTLEPDVISIYNNDNGIVFGIFDAKYYNITLKKESKLSGQPGIGDITKQYLYQLAYKDIFKDIDELVFKNSFLVPTYESEFKNIGYVKLDMFKIMELEDIQIIQVPTNEVFERYLTNETIDINLLKLK